MERMMAFSDRAANRLDGCFGAVLAVVLAWCASAGSLRAESYALPLTDTPPVIDGKLDDACWQQAVVLDRFVKLGGQEMAPDERVETRAMLAGDRENLYIAVYCGEPLIDKLVMRHTERDSAVWQDDDIEVMIVPCERGADRYIQIAVNPRGAFMDAYIPALRTPLERDYDSGATIKTQIGADHWTVEMQLPLANLPIESVEGPWSFHIARARRTKSMYLTSLKQPVSGFHDLDAFAELTGIEQLELPLGLKNFSLGELMYGQNVCTFEVVGDKTQLTSMAIEVGGEPRILFDDAALQIMTGTMRLPFTLTAADRGKSLAVKAYSGTRLLQSRVSTLNRLPERLLDGASRSVHFHYPGRFVELELPINVVGSSEQPLKLQWQATDLQGRPVGSGQTTPSGTVALVRLYWPSWKPGTYRFMAQLHQSGQPVADVTQELRLIANPWEASE